MISLRQTRQSDKYREAQEPTDPVTVILFTGLVAEVILPWAVIWLSDMFFFDVPAWSQWVIFGGPAVLSLLPMLVYWDLRTWSKQPRRAGISAHSGHA
jgi:hypothetical protein